MISPIYLSNCDEAGFQFDYFGASFFSGLLPFPPAPSIGGLPPFAPSLPLFPSLFPVIKGFLPSFPPLLDFPFDGALSSLGGVHPSGGGGIGSPGYQPGGGGGISPGGSQPAGAFFISPSIIGLPPLPYFF